MKAEISPRDLLLAQPWRRALFTTYSLSLSFVEAAVLTAIPASHDLTIVADLEGYRSSLSDAGAIGAGRTYEIAPVSVRGGVFHPKVTVLVDADGEIRTLVGSGNLTFGGWGRNTEFLEYLTPATDGQAYADLAGFLTALSDVTGPDRTIAADRKLDLGSYIETARRAARASGRGSARLLHSIGARLDDQVASLAADLGGAISVTVASPFFSGIQGVQRLASALNCDRVGVAMPSRTPMVFDFEAARAVGLDVDAVTCDLVDDPRSLHGKLFDIECANGRLLVAGSANATIPAWSGSNVEVMVARVHDRTHSLGWRRTGTYPQVTGEREPQEAAGACLIARYDGAAFVGRILGGGAVAGSCRATLLWGTRSAFLGTINVEPGGSFTAPVPEDHDLGILHISSQIQLDSETGSIRGWVMLEPVLAAIKEKGSIARAVLHVMQGLDSDAELGGMLEFFAAYPEELIEAARTPSSGAERPGASPGGNVEIEPGQLEPESALAGSERARGAAGATAFDGLKQALVRRLASMIPETGEDEAVDEEEPSGSPQRRADPARGKGRRGVSNRKVAAIIEAIVCRLDGEPAGARRGLALPMLFHMICVIVPRAQRPDDLLLPSLRRWLHLSVGCRTGGAAHDDLDRIVATLVTGWVLLGVWTASGSHAWLQSWLRRRLDDGDREKLKPRADSVDAARIEADADQSQWDDAWSSVVESRTALDAVVDLIAALDGERDVPAENSLNEDELRRVRRMREGGLDKAKARVIVTEVQRNPQACPGDRCHTILPTFEAARRRRDRVATCLNGCGRLILDLSL